jgi:polyisoprenoid-binding protein YceI
MLQRYATHQSTLLKETPMKRILLLSLVLSVVLSLTCQAEQIKFSNFDQNHSTIGFAVSIAGGTSEVDGKFTSFTADFVYDTKDITKSSVEVVIEAASINTGLPDRDNDLRSGSFFDVAKYPRIRFISSQFARRGDDLVVAGTLEMRGIRKEIELICQLKGPQVDGKTNKVFIGAAATTTLNRRDFGITWQHTVPNFVGDDVIVSIHLISKLTARPDPPQNSQ